LKHANDKKPADFTTEFKKAVTYRVRTKLNPPKEEKQEDENKDEENE
jgi:hypothetical protein